MTLDNPNDWSRVFEGNFQIAQFGSYKGRIEPIITPSLTQHTIKIHTTSISAEPTWWYAGRLTQILGTTEQIEATQSKIPLNRTTLIQLPVLTLGYRLKFEAARWHKHIQIIVDIYTGLTA